MKRIEFEGAVHEFPDDFTDADISSALGGSKQSFGDLALSSLKTAVANAPGQMLEDVKTLPGKAVSAFNEVTSPSTALPLVAGGPGSTVLKRLGAFAVGRMLEDAGTPNPDRPETFTENVKSAAKGVFGDPTMGTTRERITSVATSPAAIETALPFLGKIMRSTPGAKARINEGQSQELLEGIGRTNRVAREAIEAAPVSEFQEAPRTAAQIRRGFESGGVEQAAQQRFGQVLDRVANAAGNPALNGPAVQRAYDMMPQLAREELVGAVNVGASGIPSFTLQQAQAIRSWVGSPAFAESTLGQGVGKVPQQRLWGGVSQEMEHSISHNQRALQLWRANNRAYSSIEAIQEGLTQGNAFQGQPNRTFLNRNALSDYLAKNEKDLVPRMDREGFDYLVNRVLGGAQPGTRDVLASGSGTASDAAMQSVGRGTNTGSMNAVGVPVRTALPGVGNQYTGQAPYTLPPRLQAIVDVVLSKMGGAALKGP